MKCVGGYVSKYEGQWLRVFLVSKVHDLGRLGVDLFRSLGTILLNKQTNFLSRETGNLLERPNRTTWSCHQQMKLWLRKSVHSSFCPQEDVLLGPVPHTSHCPAFALMFLSGYLYWMLQEGHQSQGGWPQDQEDKTHPAAGGGTLRQDLTALMCCGSVDTRARTECEEV